MRKVNVLVCYDVKVSDPEGPRRLRRIARACRNHGVRVQYSVFECVLEPKDWVVLRARLLDEMDAVSDSLRFYFLSEDVTRKTEHHGARVPLDVEGPLIL
ncbi:CRISPR-associated endonuclease Cas2 [Myxococcus sp. K15C18031901]|uniref:CRISPR-associated endonuclease Cas2 n=1 Tax=Myxococcus dinghuensis TaxID=2906761 RepID=UPI0020A7DABB|nr:CRISPR-associated endonuclease Cas2 [Myxococcus dinghuensis]MCP3105462.1 CRISPR-associated endonuclease Cas2 [Myxococcus dinghuensis]